MDRFVNSAPKPADSNIAPASSTTSERGRFIILRVTYALTPGGKPRIEYADLKKHFAGFQNTPSLTSTSRSRAPHTRGQSHAHHSG